MRTIPVSKAKAQLSGLLDEVYTTQEAVSITKGGCLEGVLISIDEYESLLETLEILSDPEMMEAIGISEREIETGKLVSLEELKGE